MNGIYIINPCGNKIYGGRTQYTWCTPLLIDSRYCVYWINDWFSLVLGY